MPCEKKTQATTAVNKYHTIGRIRPDCIACVLGMAHDNVVMMCCSHRHVDILLYTNKPTLLWLAE